jgi:putative hydrolase of the HAD superfamily
VGEAFAQLGIDAPEVVRSFADYYSALRDEAIRPLPGAIDALRAFSVRGLSLAVVSNGGAEPQRAKIDRFGLEPFFDAILIEGEWGVGKPDSSIFLEALCRLDVPPTDAWMVGDNLEADIAGGQAAGLYAVWNDLERRGLPESSSIRPDRIIHQLSDLL